MPGFHAGRPPRNKGRRYPADPPTVEEIVVMRQAGATPHGLRMRGLIVVLTTAARPPAGVEHARDVVERLAPQPLIYERGSLGSGPSASRRPAPRSRTGRARTTSERRPTDEITPRDRSTCTGPGQLGPDLPVEPASASLPTRAAVTISGLGLGLPRRRAGRD
jgi:hypothetical protein